VEKTSYQAGVRIDRSDIGPLFQVASNAAKTKILDIVGAVVLTPNDVIDLVGSTEAYAGRRQYSQTLSDRCRTASRTSMDSVTMPRALPLWSASNEQLSVDRLAIVVMVADNVPVETL
jgi:hypothetical protein